MSRTRWSTAEGYFARQQCSAVQKAGCCYCKLLGWLKRRSEVLSELVLVVSKLIDFEILCSCHSMQRMLCV